MNNYALSKRLEALSRRESKSIALDKLVKADAVTRNDPRAETMERRKEQHFFYSQICNYLNKPALLDCIRNKVLAIPLDSLCYLVFQLQKRKNKKGDFVYNNERIYNLFLSLEIPNGKKESETRPLYERIVDSFKTRVGVLHNGDGRLEE